LLSGYDWNLHLISLTNMLNLFAASGHNSYTKSARLYLQIMFDLPTTYPWLHEQLSSRGFHAVRRSERYWAGLSTDLIIEQVMMRSVMSRGGLTHGPGMTESVRLLWVSSMHKCGTVYSALNDLVKASQSSDDNEHADMGPSQVRRDTVDLNTIVRWFRSHNPLTVTDRRLHSLSSGVAASHSDGINCHEAEAVGARIMSKMDDVVFTDVVLKKIDQAKTLEHIGNKVLIGTKKLVLDCTILFSRLLVIIQRNTDIEPFFRYELTATPTALFTDTSMRKCVKSVLAKELKKHVSTDTVVSIPKTFVVDGGWLLHKVKWHQIGTYADVVHQYVQYIKSRFGSGVTIVSDGYGNGATIKDHEHDRRSLQAFPDIVFDP